MKKFKDLQKELRKAGLDRPYLAKLLGVSVASLNDKFSGRSPWRLKECYAILELLDANSAMLNYYFSKRDVYAA